MTAPFRRARIEVQHLLREAQAEEHDLKANRYRQMALDAVRPEIWRVAERTERRRAAELRRAN